MARELILRVTDDFTGDPADEQVVLGWDGYDYSLDLSSKNYKKLLSLLEPYLEAAHEKKKQTRRKGQRPADELGADKLTKAERSEIRKWAQDNGHPVGDKGVIAKAIIEAYREAQ
ncbi:Lsr2-like DNA bridging protein [Gordonia phage Anon]|nr:Lsr2-like DNA bridging protein [Gordonia phage Anon]